MGDNEIGLNSNNMEPPQNHRSVEATKNCEASPNTSITFFYESVPIRKTQSKDKKQNKAICEEIASKRPSVMTATLPTGIHRVVAQSATEEKQDDSQQNENVDFDSTPAMAGGDSCQVTMEPDPNPSSSEEHRILSVSSSLKSDVRSCRICWNGDEKEELIQPCDCTGTSAYVHSSCLSKWFHMTMRFNCEVCKFKYQFKQSTKPITQWSWRCGKTRNVTQLEATLLLIGLITPPLVCGIIVSSQEMAHYSQNPENGWRTAGSLVTLVVLVLASVITYAAALAYLCFKIRAVYRQWMQTNQRTVVQLAEVEAVVETTPKTQELAQSDTASYELDLFGVWSIT